MKRYLILVLFSKVFLCRDNIVKTSRLIHKFSTLLAFTISFAIFQPASIARTPWLFYYFGYFNITNANCVSIGYQTLAQHSLQRPPNVVGEQYAPFAIGQNASTMTIIDCSEVAKSGRVTVMASSNESGFSSTYPQTILNSFQSILNSSQGFEN